MNRTKTLAFAAPALGLLALVSFRSSESASPVGQEGKLIEEADALDTGMGAELYVYVTKPTRGFGEVVKILPDHMDFIHRIETEGTMVMGGQTTLMGEMDAGGNGMVVIRANSFEEAKRIADQDPMHKTGVRSYELYRWQINEGRVFLSLKFSDQSFELR